MVKFFIVVLLLFASTDLFAGSVNCYNQDCLRFGWEVQSPLYRADLKCLNNDCRKSGWEMVDNFADIIAVCKNQGDCLLDGWNTFDRATGKYVGTANCLKGNCLNYGWVYKTKQGNSTRLTCKNNNCTSEGYRMIIPGGLSYEASCRSGNCLSNGAVLNGY